MEGNQHKAAYAAVHGHSNKHYIKCKHNTHFTVIYRHIFGSKAGETEKMIVDRYNMGGLVALLVEHRTSDS